MRRNNNVNIHHNPLIQPNRFTTVSEKEEKKPPKWLKNVKTCSEEYDILSKKTREILNKSRQSKRKKKREKFTDEIFCFHSSDKNFKEEWKFGQSPWNFPASYRMWLFGLPDSGKTAAIKNVLVRTDPPFERIQILQLGLTDKNNGKKKSEWSELEGAEIINSVPEPDSYDDFSKKLLIIEDMDFKGMDHEDQSRLDRLASYTSSHRNLSIMLTAQDFFDLQPSVRRKPSVIVLWPTVDLDSLKCMARKSGLTPDDFAKIFKTMNKHDSFWIDLTDSSPYKYRKNGHIKIEESFFNH